MGKKTKKPGKGKEKTERKTAKAEEKKARRESKKVSEEDDIDAILRNIQKEEAKKKEVLVEDNVPAPSPRSNCSLTINPSKETELILYGGEFYNGSKTFVYGDLYRYDVEKNEWKSVSSPNSPPPRSAHQAVAWKNHIYVFGGEFTSPNQERFHHYKSTSFEMGHDLGGDGSGDDDDATCATSIYTKDFWMLDLKTNQWEHLLQKGCPSARSGHRMVLYKHKIIVFGGFYDTLREALFVAAYYGYEKNHILTRKYFNDLHVFDLDQFKWQEIKPRLGGLWPSARSGFNLFVFQDEIFLYGGYSKEAVPDKNGSEKGIIHSDMWSLDPRTWEWSKIKKSGMPPGPRAGFSLCLHKKRAVLFGGVVDMEVEGDVLMSVFMNELYGFQLDSRRWYPLELRKDKPIKEKSKGCKKYQPSKSSTLPNLGSQEDLEMYAATDVENEDNSDEADSMQCDVKVVSHDMNKSLVIDDVVSTKKADVRVQGLAGNSDLQVCASSEAMKPCGRINSCMVVGRDTLYMYGGMMEIRDQEITLDDLYSLNLSKLDEWKCIIPASESEWLEVSEDEEDESTDDEENSNGSNSDDTGDDDDDEDEDDIKPGENGEKTLDVGNAVSILKGEKKNIRRKEKRARIEQIRVSLGLSDSQRTPVPGETLKDFYKRTNMYWQMAAYEHTQHTGKELRKDGFDLAESRFKELKPILDELVVLEAEQKAEEDEGPESSSKKRSSNKNKQRNPQR